MQIFVTITSGKSITLKLAPSDTVTKLKSKIEATAGTPVHQQELTHKKTQLLDDSSTLKENGIEDQATITLSKKPFEITVLTSDNEVINLTVEEEAKTVQDLKKQLEKIGNRPAIYQRLFLENNELQKKALLSNLQKKPNLVLYLTLMKNIKLCVVIPGGRVKQPYPHIHTKVDKLKEMLEDSGVVHCDQKLYYGKTELDGNSTIYENRLEPGSTLYMVQCKSDAIGRVKLATRDPGGRRRVQNLTVKDSTTAGDVKGIILNNTRMYFGCDLDLCHAQKSRLSDIELRAEGHNSLDDCKSLKESGIRRDWTIEATTKGELLKEIMNASLVKRQNKSGGHKPTEWAKPDTPDVQYEDPEFDLDFDVESVEECLYDDCWDVDYV